EARIGIIGLASAVLRIGTGTAPIATVEARAFRIIRTVISQAIATIGQPMISAIRITATPIAPDDAPTATVHLTIRNVDMHVNIISNVRAVTSLRSAISWIARVTKLHPGSAMTKP